MDTHAVHNVGQAEICWQFTRTSNAGFEIGTNLTAAKKYLFIPENGSWTHQYAVPDATVAGVKSAGTFTYDGGQDFPSPDISGSYKIQAEFINKTYKVIKQ